MAQQLVFTSAPQGLRPNTRGFTTVGATSSMSPPLMARLEGMSGYQLAYNLSDPRSSQNPVSHSHLLLEVGGHRLHVLARVAPAGADYSSRSNTLAHHLVLDDGDLPPVGPAALLAQPGLMMTQWTGQPRFLDEPVRLDAEDEPPRPCAVWQAAASDAGWGGALAAAFAQSPHLPAYLIYPPTGPASNVLALIRESLALLPASRRWQVTFNTYYTAAATGVTCQWRCVLQGTPAAKAAAAGSGLVIDLTQPLGAPAGGVFTDAARAGRVVETEVATAPRAVVSAKTRPVAPVREAVANGEPHAVAAREATTAGASLPLEFAEVDDGGITYEPVVARRRFPALLVAASFLLGAMVGAGTMWLLKQEAGSAPTVGGDESMAAGQPDVSKSIAAAEPREEMIKAGAAQPSVPAVVSPGAAAVPDKPEGGKPKVSQPDQAPTKNASDSKKDPESTPPQRTAVAGNAADESKKALDAARKEFERHMELLRASASDRESIQSKEYIPICLDNGGQGKIAFRACPTRIMVLRPNDPTVSINPRGNEFELRKTFPESLEPVTCGIVSFALNESDPGQILATWVQKSERFPWSSLRIVLTVPHQGNATYVLYARVPPETYPPLIVRADTNRVAAPAVKGFFPASAGPSRSPLKKVDPKSDVYGPDPNVDGFSISRPSKTSIWEIGWTHNENWQRLLGDYAKAIDELKNWDKDYKSELMMLPGKIERLKTEKKTEKIEMEIKSSQKKLDDLRTERKDRRNAVIKCRAELMSLDKQLIDRVDKLQSIHFADEFGVPVAVVKLRAEPAAPNLPDEFDLPQ